jgi:hypothetical protein
MLHHRKEREMDSDRRKISAPVIDGIEKANKEIRILQIEINRLLYDEANRFSCDLTQGWAFSQTTMEFIKEIQPSKMVGKGADFVPKH